MTAYTTTTMTQIGSFQTGLSASKDKLQGGETAFYAIDVTATRDGHIDWNPSRLKEVHPTPSTDRYRGQPGDLVFTLLTPPRAVLIHDTPLATPAIPPFSAPSGATPDTQLLPRSTTPRHTFGSPNAVALSSAKAALSRT